MAGLESPGRSPDPVLERASRPPGPLSGCDPRPPLSAALDTRAVLALQQSAGNQAVARFLRAGSLSRPAAPVLQRVRIDVPPRVWPGVSVVYTQHESKAFLEQLQRALTDARDRIGRDDDSLRLRQIEAAIRLLDDALGKGDFKEEPAGLPAREDKRKRDDDPPSQKRRRKDAAAPTSSAAPQVPGFGQVPSIAKGEEDEASDEEQAGAANRKNADPEFRARWNQRGSAAFYKFLRPILAANAQGDEDARKTLEELVEGMAQNKDNRAWILHKIRVRAKASPGAKRKSGLDELFQTASTAEWIARSAGLPSCRPHSMYRGRPFDWVAAQQMVRVRTESVVWFADDLLEGHSGAVTRESGKGWYTTGQADFHAQRDAVQRGSSTPRNAALRSIALMLRLTANVARWSNPSNIWQGTSTAGQEFADSAQRALAWAVLVTYRDKLKRAYDDLYENSWEDPLLDRPGSGYASPGEESTPAQLEQEASIAEGSEEESGEEPAGGFTDASSGKPQYWDPASSVAEEAHSDLDDPGAEMDEPQDFAGFGAHMQGPEDWRH